VAAFIFWYGLERTPLGRRVQASGANREAARLAGVATKRFVFLSFVVSGLMASVAGLLVSARVGSVSPTLGPPYLLPAFAACFLGATQIRPGRFNVWGTVLALILLATGVKGLQLAGGELWLTELFNGVALVGAVTLSVVLQKRRNRRLRQAADQALDR
jgi:ribose transport system permease protein